MVQGLPGLEEIRKKREALCIYWEIQLKIRRSTLKVNVRSVLNLLRYCTASDLQWLLSQEQLNCSWRALGGFTHVTRPVVLQIANRAVISCCDDCAVSSNCEHVIFLLRVCRYDFVYGVCNGNTTAAVEEYRLRYPRRRIHDRRVFTRVHQHLWEKGSFPSVNRHAERQVQRSVEDDENIIDMVQRSPRTSTRRISAHAWESGEHCTQKECIRTTSNGFSILNLRTCVAGWTCTVGLILTPVWFVTFVHRQGPFYPRWSQEYKKLPFMGSW